MIAVGLTLLAVGGGDLVRRFIPARLLAGLIAGFTLLVVASLVGAPLAGLLALAVAAGWIVLMPSDGAGRAGFWPPVVLGILCAVMVALVPARDHPGPIGASWHVVSPAGPLALDAAILIVGALVAATESANIVVRTALHGAMASDDDQGPSLRGGRLIGPLERVLLFGLTLASALPLAAALLAAKGIVRFPEISKDGVGGYRAEYFLVGSLVSWTIALALAVLSWWALGAAG